MPYAGKIELPTLSDVSNSQEHRTFHRRFGRRMWPFIKPLIYLLNGHTFPALWELACKIVEFVSWKSEANKPLIEQPPRHLLQQRNPPPVHLDQVIIGSQDGGDALLDRKD